MPVCCDSATGTRTDDRLFLVSVVSILKATRFCFCPYPLLQLSSGRGCWHAPQQPLQQGESVQFCSPGIFYTSNHFSPYHHFKWGKGAAACQDCARAVTSDCSWGGRWAPLARLGSSASRWASCPNTSQLLCSLTVLLAALCPLKN